MSILSHTTESASRADAGFFEPVVRPFVELAAYLRRHNEYAAAEARLLRLSDRELADIGLARTEIHTRVWQDFARV